MQLMFIDVTLWSSACNRSTFSLVNFSWQPFYPSKIIIVKIETDTRLHFSFLCKNLNIMSAQVGVKKVDI